MGLSHKLTCTFSCTFLNGFDSVSHSPEPGPPHRHPDVRDPLAVATGLSTRAHRGEFATLIPSLHRLHSHTFPLSWPQKQNPETGTPTPPGIYARPGHHIKISNIFRFGWERSRQIALPPAMGPVP